MGFSLDASLTLRAVVLGGALVCAGCDNAASAGEPSDRSGPPPAPVVDEAIEDRPFIERRIFFGQVRAASEARLSPAESGRVSRVHVLEGQEVKRGTLLVELDDRLARVEWDQARAQKRKTSTQRQQAALEADRFSAMRESNIVSELEASRKESDAASLVAQAESADARVALGAERLRRHRIEAPFDGIVTARFVDPGDWLQAGEVALSMLTAGHVEVDVGVSAKLLDQVDRISRVLIVREGAEADPRLDARSIVAAAGVPTSEDPEGGSITDRKDVVEAHIDSVVDALDPMTRTALFRVTPRGETPPRWLRPGAAVDVVFYVERRDGVTIPRDALVYGVAGQRVLVNRNNRAEPVEVEVLAQSPTWALVRAPELSVGDAVVVRGNERLRPGQALTTEGAVVPASVGGEKE